MMIAGVTRIQVRRTVGATCVRPQDEIKKLSSVYENVSVAKSAIMPNHVHMILEINQAGGTEPLPYRILSGVSKHTQPKHMWKLVIRQPLRSGSVPSMNT
jgi:REP element-mobilizing transposase RayT